MVGQYRNLAIRNVEYHIIKQTILNNRVIHRIWDETNRRECLWLPTIHKGRMPFMHNTSATFKRNTFSLHSQILTEKRMPEYTSENNLRCDRVTVFYVLLTQNRETQTADNQLTTLCPLVDFPSFST